MSLNDILCLIYVKQREVSTTYRVYTISLKNIPQE